MTSVAAALLLFVAGCTGEAGGKSPGDETAPTTTANPAGGTYDAEQVVSLTCQDDDSGCTETHYTLDGSAPTAASPLYTSPFPVDVDSTLRFFSVDVDGNVEAALSEVYDIAIPNPALAHCQILWSNLGTGANRYDVYVVDMPIELWTTGTKTYSLVPGARVTALFYDEYDFANAMFAARAITTSGTFEVTTASTASGSSIVLNDPGAQTYFDPETGALVGSGGTATFDGNWSSPNPTEPPDPGTGSVTLNYQGADLNIGVSFVNYGVCY